LTASPPTEAGIFLSGDGPECAPALSPGASKGVGTARQQSSLVEQHPTKSRQDGGFSLMP
jgi:hypothetical protein